MSAKGRVQFHSTWTWRYINVQRQLSRVAPVSGPASGIPAELTLWVLADGNTRDKLLTLSAFTLWTTGRSFPLETVVFWVFDPLCDSKKLEMQIVTTINKLPPELLERIFSMLSFSDRKTAVLVCRFLVHFSICFWFVIWNMTVSFAVRECFAKNVAVLLEFFQMK